MTITDLQYVNETLIDLYDFVSANCDGDESGIYGEMSIKFSNAINIIQAEQSKNYLKNAKARVKRQRK